jgi:hypothetical protein
MDAHLLCLVSVVVDTQDVPVAVCCVDVLHNVVHPACCGCCAGLLLRLEEEAESLVTQIIFYCVLAGGRGCGRDLQQQRVCAGVERWWWFSAIIKCTNQEAHWEKR